MKVLVGCEFSQVVTQAFRDKGHEAYSCDVLPTEGNPDWHIQGDVREVLTDDWDLVIFHPPCTYLSNSGVRWLYNADGSKNVQRWEDMREATEFFNELLTCDIPKIAIENPIQLNTQENLSKSIILRQYSLTSLDMEKRRRRVYGSRI